MQVQVGREDRAGDGPQRRAAIPTQKSIYDIVNGEVCRREHLRTAHREYQVVCSIVIVAQVFNCFEPGLRTSICFNGLNQWFHNDSALPASIAPWLFMLMGSFAPRMHSFEPRSDVPHKFLAAVVTAAWYPANAATTEQIAG